MGDRVADCLPRDYHLSLDRGDKRLENWPEALCGRFLHGLDLKLDAFGAAA
jgi:hypothetical protein